MLVPGSGNCRLRGYSRNMAATYAANTISETMLKESNREARRNIRTSNQGGKYGWIAKPAKEYLRLFI